MLKLDSGDSSQLSERETRVHLESGEGVSQPKGAARAQLSIGKYAFLGH
jgi:hypothetical protein